MRVKQRLITMLLVMAFFAGGCTTIVRTSLTEIPETLDNIPYVAQGRPIRIGIEGTDDYYTVDVDGYYLVHKNDMEAIMRELSK